MPLPINISVMDINSFINTHNCKQVSSMFIKESTSNEFHPQGLFSEEIFGQIGTPQRLISFGYIELRTKIFHPTIYAQLVRLKALYGEVLAGKTYAVYDATEEDLVAVGDNDEEGKTGYKFFVDTFPKLNLKKNASITRNDKIDLINKYKKICLIDKYLVLPAGIRDMSIDDGKPAADSINKLYTSIMNYAHAMPSIGSESDIFDTVRFAIQKKANEIYTFIFDMIEGKHGFFQKKYGARNLALGTRNVVSPADMQAASPTDPKFLKCDEVRLPLFEACKMYQPLVVYNMKQMFFSDVFSQFSDKVSVIDPKTLNLIYQPISEDEKNKFLSTEGLEKILSLFRDKEHRYRPVTITSEEGKSYYFLMVYDDNKTIRLTRSVSELKLKIQQQGITYDNSKLRPITYAELIYIATYRATLGKHATVTRYPALELGSCVPCKAHISSSSISRSVTLKTESGVDWVLPEYPVIGSLFNDSAVLHPSILAGLNADFDGDSVTYSTTITYRYLDNWLENIGISNYPKSNQNGAQLVQHIKQHTYKHADGWSYVRMCIGDFPRPGRFMLDNHGAQVYVLPDGAEILSYNDNKCSYSWEPMTHVTYHEHAVCVKIKVGYATLETTDNESVAAFDHKTGSIIKTSPTQCVSDSLFVPYFKKDPAPMDTAECLWNELSEYIDNYEDTRCVFSNWWKHLLVPPDKSQRLHDICYGLGIRCDITFDLYTAMCTVKICVADMIPCLDKLTLKKATISEHYMWQGHSALADTEDRIPLSDEEVQLLDSIFFVGREADAIEDSPWRISKNEYREFLMRNIEKIPVDSQLYKRIMDTNTMWSKVEILEEIGLQPVFDFEIPTTKVFCVNNGIITYDTLSFSGILTNEANEEIHKHINSIERYVHTNGSLFPKHTDLINLTIHNLSR